MFELETTRPTRWRKIQILAKSNLTKLVHVTAASLREQALLVSIIKLENKCRLTVGNYLNKNNYIGTNTALKINVADLKVYKVLLEISVT